MTIWGNHSATQYPDLFHAEVDGKNAADAVGDQAWLEDDVHPHGGQQRGAAIIEARGAVVGRLGRQRRHRPHPRLGPRHPRGRLGVDGHPVRRQLRRARGPDLVVPVHLRRTASTRSSRASTSTTSPGPGSTPRWPSWPRSATPSGSSASSEPTPPAGIRAASRDRPRASARCAVRRRYFRNLRRGVVGQHLAAGLAGRAVVDRVGVVLDGPDRVAAHRARLARLRWCTAPGRSADERHVVAGSRS